MTDVPQVRLQICVRKLFAQHAATRREFEFEGKKRRSQG
jgi:hypothetical protein